MLKKMLFVLLALWAVALVDSTLGNGSLGSGVREFLQPLEALYH
jgi:hypothetical protein